MTGMNPELHPGDTERVTVETVSAALRGVDHGRIYRTRPGCVRVDYATNAAGKIDTGAAEKVVAILAGKRDAQGWRVMPNVPQAGNSHASVHDLAVWHPEGGQYLDNA